MVKTPHLDALVQRGFTFTNAYNLGGNSPAVCMPSRAMVMTGRTLFHLHDSGSSLPPEHVLLGEVLGVVLSLLLRDVIRWPLNPSVYFIDTLPVQIDPARCAVVGLFTLTMVLGSTLYPSWKAASLDPVEGLRYE